MMRKFHARVKGYLRLVNVDSIGITVYGERGSNFDLIAQTDGDLNIAKFVEVYPEQGYSLSEFSEDLVTQDHHYVGQPSLIPFICDGVVNAIGGDRYASDLDALSTNTPQGDKIKADVKELLSRAREGFFYKHLEGWSDSEFESAFPEVFEERPIHSRYWISRFKNAVNQNRKREVPSGAVRASLRRVGVRWLELFGAKTDTRLLSMLFDEENRDIFSIEDRTSTFYAYLANKFANKEFSYLERFAISDPHFLGLFPEGLYYYDLRNTGLKSHFAYRRPDDYLLEIKTRIYAASDGRNYRRMKGLAIVLFGTKDVPVELIKSLQSARRVYVDRFNSAIAAFRDVQAEKTFPQVIVDKDMMDIARIICDSYEILVDIEAAEYGGARLSPRLYDFLSFDKKLVEQVGVCIKFNVNYHGSAGGIV